MKKNRPRSSSPLPLQSLSPKEKAFLEFVESQMKTTGICPSYQEIMDHFGFASFNSVQNYLRQLTNKGYIEMPAHQKRAIRILHSAQALQEDLERRLSTEPSRGSLLQARGEVLSLPLLGKVAAGQPLERIKNDEFVEVPPHMVKKPDSTFVLEVEGDSMIDDGIWDGDYLLIQKQQTAKNGDIIVASVDNEATVKRFYLKTGSQEDATVELRPSNPRLKSMWYSPDVVEIRGLVVGLLRRY
ncbi:MAG: transcriptional repressor LexA [Bdellovibrionaceae bacterium]|nr:transcriptional repressor LexA [Pseudobdellovibrionaceae bacterium]